MTDVSTADWFEADASNTTTPPDGWPAGMAANAVEGAARAMRGAVKRWYNHANATLTSGGSANVQTLTYGTAPAAYVTGDGYVFKAGFTNSGATTLNVNALGAKAVQFLGAALVGNEIVSGRVALVYYDGTVFQLINSQTLGLAAVATSGSAADLTTGTLPPARLNGLNQIGAALGADVALNNTALFFTGPSIAQGSTGTWFVTGQVTVIDSTNQADFIVLLWDGTTVIASSKISGTKISGYSTVTLSGTIVSPAGNLRLSVSDVTSTNGAIKFNATGFNKDSFIVAYRIA